MCAIYTSPLPQYSRKVHCSPWDEATIVVCTCTVQEKKYYARASVYSVIKIRNWPTLTTAVEQVGLLYIQWTKSVTCSNLYPWNLGLDCVKVPRLGPRVAVIVHDGVVVISYTQRVDL